MCAEDLGNSGTAVELEPCDGSSAQDWDDFSAYENTQSGEPTTHHGLCLNGEIFNTEANLCLADPGSSTAKGTKLVLEDCDGDAGEIWAVG
jgi:hypothetical protein